MPELTWTTALAWFGVLAGATSVAALIHGLVTSRQTTRLQDDIHAATQAMLTDLGKGFRETQQQLSQTLERMDERWREAFERMDQRADDRHREVLQALQALKG
jgi:DNA anti-recombination protein RmuC